MTSLDHRLPRAVYLTGASAATLVSNAEFSIEEGEHNMPMQTTSIDNAVGDGIDAATLDAAYVVLGGVAVVSDTDDGINCTAGDQSISNSGTVAGGDNGVEFGDGSDNETLVNASTGQIQGQKGVAISSGFAVSVVNYGAITGLDYAIDDTSGGNNFIQNFGGMYGLNAAMFVDGQDDILNTGTMSGGQTGITVTGGIVTLDNAGLLRGGEGAIVDEFLGTHSTLHLLNRGTIDGDINLDNAVSDSVRNKGTINGSVTLGDDGDTFDGRGGTVDGTITGGNGADTIHLGNDGETVNGGLGHDTIYGGTGADTFAFTSDGSANFDTIHGFNVVNDTIELSHAVFTKLAIGATPVFSIGTKATSASDHLYYNSAAGGLWYDADGNGPGAAVAIANLGAGLKLTAHDFTVVA